MTKREFLGHLQCSWRYSKLQWMIENGTIEEVLQLKEINDQLIRTPRYQELKKLIEARLA